MCWLTRAMGLLTREANGDRLESVPGPLLGPLPHPTMLPTPAERPGARSARLWGPGAWETGAARPAVQSRGRGVGTRGTGGPEVPQSVFASRIPTEALGHADRTELPRASHGLCGSWPLAFLPQTCRTSPAGPAWAAGPWGWHGGHGAPPNPRPARSCALGGSVPAPEESQENRSARCAFPEKDNVAGSFFS